MPKQYRSFEAARSYVRSLGLRSTPEFEQWSCSGARPDDIPSNPARIYKGAGWVGIADFLGFTPRMKARSATWRPHEEARSYVRALGLRSARDYGEWAATPDRPADIPTNPNIVYKGAGWVSYPDFLGYKARGSEAKVAWRPYREAHDRADARSVPVRIEAPVAVLPIGVLSLPYPGKLRSRSRCPGRSGPPGRGWSSRWRRSSRRPGPRGLDDRVGVRVHLPGSSGRPC